MTIQYDATYAYKLDAEDELAHFRNKFVIRDSEQIYMDGNSLGRMPRATGTLVRKMTDEQWSKRLIKVWNDGWFHLPQRIGAKVAQLIGAQPDEVIMADSTSINLYKLALAAVLARPQRAKIITDNLNFPSDVYVLQGIADLVGGRRIEMIPSEDGIYGPEEGIRSALDDNTALLTLSHTVFKSGYVYNMNKLTDAAHQAGALVLWDLSHSVGALPVALNEAKADLAIGCTYKYLNGGPGSPAFLYVRRDLQDKLRNPIQGWMGQKNLFDFGLDYEPQKGIDSFLTGTPQVMSLAAVEPGVDIMLEAGMEQIREKSVKQTEYFIALHRHLLEPLGFRLQTPPEAKWRGSHVSLGHDDAWRIDQALIEDMNVLPDFREPDNIRFGIAPLYTSYSDIYTAVIRLRTIVIEGLHEKYSADRATVT